MCLCVVSLVGCSSHDAHSIGLHPSDVLNRKARVWQYRDLDSTLYYASKAYDEAGHYIHGRSVACNMLGFVAFMKMNYEESLYWYGQVERQSGCELERLVADVGQMNVYQRMADNLAFYDCRVRAMKRLAHIYEESAEFSVAERCRLQSVVNDFHMISALHHYMIGQRPEADAEMLQVIDDEALHSDSAQWLMYTYIKGIGLNTEGDTREQRWLRCYTYLNNCLRTSRSRGYRYFEGLALSGLSELLSDSLRMAHIAKQRPGSFAQLIDYHSASDDYCISFAQGALQCLEAYGDCYGVLNGHIQVASLYNKEEDVTFLKETFPSLELANYLKEHPYDEIELCGLVSNICVLTNVVMVKAALPNAKIIVDRSATASFDEKLNKETFDILNGIHVEVI